MKKPLFILIVLFSLSSLGANGVNACPDELQCPGTIDTVESCHTGGDMSGSNITVPDTCAMHGLDFETSLVPAQSRPFMPPGQLYSVSHLEIDSLTRNDCPEPPVPDRPPDFPDTSIQFLV